MCEMAYFLGLPLPRCNWSSLLGCSCSKSLFSCILVRSPPRLEYMFLNLAIFSFLRHRVHTQTPRQKGHSPFYLIFS